MRRRSSATDLGGRTAFVILEYCGGARTEALHERLSEWNPRTPILVLDNASPVNQASCVTHRNAVNSYVGGGIRDCLALAETLGAQYLFYCVNDVEHVDPLLISDFEGLMNADPDVVMVSCSLTPVSHQSVRFPWMVRQEGGGVRRVRVADPICCLLRLDFIRSFGGFPISRGGWGYSSEMAFHAKEQNKKIYVNDACTVRHVNAQTHLVAPDGKRIHKGYEADEVYRRRYGADPLRGALNDPNFDEFTPVALLQPSPA